MFPAELDSWLREHAEALDAGSHESLEGTVLDQLGAAGLFRHGVPVALGGSGGDVRDALQAIAWVAERSLTAAFVFWGQRTCIEYLLSSPNKALGERWLPELLSGQRAGATGLSNAMKFLSGIEQLGIELKAGQEPGSWRLDGRLPWATNLAPRGFLVALAVAAADGSVSVLALPSERAGLSRSADHDLIALRGSQTAALQLTQLQADAHDLIHAQARHYLPQVRPSFLGLQCGLSIGLSRAALAAAEAHLGPARSVLQAPLQLAQHQLAELEAALLDGLAEGRFVAAAAELFRLRIALAEVAQQAVQLELQACGGRAYHRDGGLGFARRWREAAFVPIVTPSLSQLRGELAKQASQAASAKAI